MGYSFRYFEVILSIESFFKKNNQPKTLITNDLWLYSFLQIRVNRKEVQKKLAQVEMTFYLCVALKERRLFSRDFEKLDVLFYIETSLSIEKKVLKKTS